MPVKEAAEYLAALADLIEYHPGLADESRSLREFLDGQSTLGRSAAIQENLSAA